MTSKVYIISFSGKFIDDEYTLSYEAAKNYLESKGYNEVQRLNEEENDAGYFVSPPTDFFQESKAKVIARNLIKDPKETKHCETCGKEMKRFNQLGEEYKICEECADKMPDHASKMLEEVLGIKLESDQK